MNDLSLNGFSGKPKVDPALKWVSVHGARRLDRRSVVRPKMNGDRERDPKDGIRIEVKPAVHILGRLTPWVFKRWSQHTSDRPSEIIRKSRGRVAESSGITAVKWQSLA